jgi:hypothetical protein
MSEQSPRGSTESPSPPSPSRFSGFHAQTYEMELLVSGALTFALLQLPGKLNPSFDRAMSFVDGGERLFVVYGFVYVLLAINALIVFFATHLLLRAFWIGLVGLESVYPGGVDWERLKIGRHSVGILRRQIPPLGSSIDRLDDICSLVFSLAFSIVLTFVYSIAVVVVCLGISWGVAAAGWFEFERMFWIAFAGWVVISAGVGLLDRFAASRLREGGVADRALAAAVRLNIAVSPLRLIGPVSLVLQTRLSEKRANFLVIGSILLVTGSLMLGLFARSGLLRLDSLRYVPESPGQEGVEAKAYRSTWTDADFDEARWRPSIDTDVVTGPYVRLVLPYRPSTHNDRIAKACPELEPAREGGFSFGKFDGDDPQTRSRAAIECFVGLFHIELDGRPLTDVRFDWYTEPRHQVPGVIAYLDVRELTPGRHQLVVDAPRGELPSDPQAEDRRRQVVIPFWR